MSLDGLARRQQQLKEDFKIKISSRSTTSSGCSSLSSSSLSQDDEKLESLFRLPPLVAATTSSFKNQAKSQLAASSLAAATTVPLMIGGRSRCVVNMVPDHHDHSPASRQQPPQEPSAADPQSRSVSVVRPVVHLEPRPRRCPIHQSHQQAKQVAKKPEVLDEFMELERRASRPSGALESHLSSELHLLPSQTTISTEHQQRQQLAQFRREELELNRHVRRQHPFVVGKLEERRRVLGQVQNVWAHKDLRRALERLLDVYQQGLVFSTQTPSNNQLSSLNSWLVVDLLSHVLLTRPRLWTLDTCQLLLPVIINDLLQQPYEQYVEVALRSIRLILAHFGQLISSTLASSTAAAAARLVGVDLSREDRINKCANCRRLLLEARHQLAEWRPQNGAAHLNSAKLQAMRAELAQLFEAANLDQQETGDGARNKSKAK